MFDKFPAVEAVMELVDSKNYGQNFFSKVRMQVSSSFDNIRDANATGLSLFLSIICN